MRPGSRVSQSPGESHRHQGGTPRIVRLGPFSLYCASHPASRDAPAERAVDPDVSTSPAGLTAGVRPEARPGTRAANLTRLGDSRHPEQMADIV
jgi:hypothetical protein